MKFPLNTSRIIDKYGVLWIYDAKSKAWIDMGYNDVYTNVSESNDGLVSTSLFEVLESIDPENLNGLKLSTNTKASFYYLYSSDHTAKFRYEEMLGERHVRIEVNNASLSKKFYEFKCSGVKGQKGDRGEKGITGIPAAREKIYKLDIDQSGAVSVEVSVSTPIDTPVSLRLIKNQEQIGEFLVHSDGEVTYSFVEGYSLKEGSIYDIYLANDILHGHFEIAGDLTGSWSFKARQVGPSGSVGPDGKWFLEADNVEITDDNLRSNQAVYEIMTSDIDIAYTRDSVSNKLCAVGFTADDPAFHKFQIDPASWPNPTNSTLMLAVKYGSDSCKDLVRWKYNRPALSVPEINMPQWTPTNCCPGNRSSEVNPPCTECTE